MCEPSINHVVEHCKLTVASTIFSDSKLKCFCKFRSADCVFDYSRVQIFRNLKMFGPVYQVANFLLSPLSCPPSVLEPL